MDAPQNPAGAFVAEDNFGPQRRDEFIAVIEKAPIALWTGVSGLSDDQLDTRYRNWTIRQIVHHLADSHVNSYIRFKWALTEEMPTIKAYDESRWAALEDSRTGDIHVPLALLEGVHARWVQLLRSMTDAQFARKFHHPETGQDVSLNAALCSYAWHCRHHTEQITWLRQQRGW
jgi:DinB superfamily